VPAQLIAQFGGGAGGGALDLTGTGDLGARILANVPPELQSTVAPLVPGMVNAIHEAFSIALASTYWVGIAGALVAAVLVLLLKETPMRTTFDFVAASPEESAA
jgi:hypothetical protein